MPIVFAKTRARLLLLIIVCVTFPGTAQEKAYEEYEVKAAFLLKFLNYVEWPKDALQDGSAIRVGICGHDPFGDTLDHTFKDQTIRGHAIEIVRGASPEDVRKCHLVFFSREEAEHCAKWLAALQDESMLTVGEDDAFLPAGGIVNFFMSEKKVRFAIYAKRAEQAHLKISSKLLAVATIYEPESTN